MNSTKDYMTMDYVTVDKNKLIEIVKQNRITHENQYNNSVEAYKLLVENKIKEYKEELTNKYHKQIKDLDENLENFKNDWETKPAVNVEKPFHFLKSYDTAIQMLEFGLDNNVQLSSRDFQSYVMDDWAWKSEFNARNNYIVTGSMQYKS